MFIKWVLNLLLVSNNYERPCLWWLHPKLLPKWGYSSPHLLLILILTFGPRHWASYFGVSNFIDTFMTSSHRCECPASHLWLENDWMLYSPCVVSAFILSAKSGVTVESCLRREQPLPVWLPKQAWDSHSLMGQLHFICGVAQFNVLLIRSSEVLVYLV